MAKIGRNEPCPCGSGKKYKQCCGSAVTPPDRRLMERELRAVGNMLKGHEFQTTEELNAFLQESVRGKTLKWEPETAAERAQELVYQALEHPNRKERVRLGLQLFLLAYNLGNFLRRLGLPKAIKDWSLRSLQLKLIKIGGRVVRHARRIFFQLAEVAVPRDLFAVILDRVSELRLTPG